jgi:prevent-host-death family protein
LARGAADAYVVECRNITTGEVTAMTVTTLTSREFNQDTGRAKKAASEGPVIITDRGRPAHVLLSIEEYRRLTGTGMSLLEALAQTEEGSDFEFDPPKMGGNWLKPVDFD